MIGCGTMPLDTFTYYLLKVGFIPALTGAHGLRKDLVEKLKALNPRFLRFPGGCIVEGFSPETAMRFRNVIGPVWERPGHQLMWALPQL